MSQFVQRHLCLWLAYLCLVGSQQAAVAQLNDIVTIDSVFVQVEDCQLQGAVCLDMPLDATADYTFYDNGTIYTQPIAACNLDTLIAYNYTTLLGQGEWGPYQLDAWVVNGQAFSGEFMTIDELVALMNTWDPAGNWMHEADNQLIIGGNNPSDYSIMEITVLLINTTSTIGVNFSVDPKGTLLLFDAGEHEVVIEDINTALHDTFYVFIACPQTETVYTVLNVGETDTYCMQPDGLFGEVVSFENNCPNTDNTIDFQIINNNCIDYTANTVGEETACLVACDQYGFCDTTYLVINAASTGTISSNLAFQEVQVYNEGMYCFDLSDLSGDVVTVTNTCESASGETIVFEELDEAYCLNFVALNLGVDSLCYSFVDNQNNVLNTTLIVRSVQPSAEWIIDSIILGESFHDCINLSDLNGEIIDISNNCENLSGSSVEFGINNVSLCVEAVSLTAGTEKACIVTCDENYVCDTTYYQITVLDDPTLLPPTARSDDGSTFLNTSVVINVCDNDVIPQNHLTDQYIMSTTEGGNGPTYGIAFFNDDCTITYVPNDGVCDVVDRFTYVICNEADCSEAEIMVSIQCTGSTHDVQVATGFSPNGDGMNETLAISGLEAYPQHTVYVYNRWGTEVLKQQQYQSDWAGTWEDGDLPDGTYFYLIVLTKTQKVSGYLQINR